MQSGSGSGEVEIDGEHDENENVYFLQFARVLFKLGDKITKKQVSSQSEIYRDKKEKKATHMLSLWRGRT